MSCSLPAHTKVRKGIERMVADFKLVFYLHWLSHWICKFFFEKRRGMLLIGPGVNEVLLASVLGSVVFAIIAAQPLVIVGVTGPITVFN